MLPWMLGTAPPERVPRPSGERLGNGPSAITRGEKKLPRPTGRHQSLGKILREADLITEEQLQEALALQQSLGERLASILVRQNIITEKFAVTYLGRQIGIPGVDLSKQKVDFDLLRHIPLELCREKLVFPLRVESGRLVVAMHNPRDEALIEEIERARGLRLTPQVALESALKGVIERAGRALEKGRGASSPPPSRTSSAQPHPPPGSGPKGKMPVGSVAPTFETLGGTKIVPAEAAAAGPAPGQPLTSVLLADGDPASAASLQMSLSGTRRYRFVLARVDDEALVKAPFCDIAILDTALPGIHGFELCRRMKARCPTLPILLISAVHSGWRYAEDARECLGVVAYMNKPVEPAELTHHLEAALGQPPQADTARILREHLEKAIAALGRDRLDEAEAELRQGLLESPWNDLLQYYLGMLFEKKEMPFDAMDRYETALRVNPEFLDALALLARLYERMGFRRKAAETWERALVATKDESSREQIKAKLAKLV